jgi:glycosyltransferase involved in cell wall biosynthesis
MLAIVIPYYKLTFFEATLQSLSSQTDKRFKVYIGDDASPEDPSLLIEKYFAKINFKYLRFEENLGGISLTKQWERCIALSGDEEWLMVLGDDDVLGINVVEEFYGNLPEIESNDVNVVRFSTQKIDGVANKISRVFEHPKLESAVDFLFRKTRSSLSDYVFNKEKVKEIGFRNLPLAWFSDVLAVLEFSMFKNVFTINDAVIAIRISNESISGNQNNLKFKSESTFDFYYYLLTIRNNQFSENQKKELRLSICKCYLNNKKRLIWFLKISILYISDCLIKEYCTFIKSIFLNFLTHKNANRL